MLGFLGFFPSRDATLCCSFFYFCVHSFTSILKLSTCELRQFSLIIDPIDPFKKTQCKSSLKHTGGM